MLLVPTPKTGSVLSGGPTALTTSFCNTVASRLHFLSIDLIRIATQTLVPPFTALLCPSGGDPSTHLYLEFMVRLEDESLMRVN